MKVNVKFKSNIGDVVKAIDEAVYKGLRASAEEVSTDAKLNAPWLYGRLRASIGYSVNGESSEGFGNEALPQDMNIQGRHGSAIIGTNVVYARKMEFGGSRKAPNGYMRIAIDMNREKVKKIMVMFLKRIGGGS